MNITKYQTKEALEEYEKELETERDDIEEKYDNKVTDYITTKEYRENNLLLSSVRGILELKEQPEGKPIYIVERKRGENSGWYDAFFIDNTWEGDYINRIFIPSEMQKNRKGDYLFRRTGGNYSFEHSIVYDLGYLVHNDGYYFKDRKL